MRLHSRVCTVAVALMWGPASVAQQPAGVVNRSWDSVVALVKPGHRVAVTLRDGQRFDGRAHSAGADALTLMDADSTERVIPRPDITRIEWAGVRSHRAWKYGAPLGFLIMGTVAVIADHGQTHYTRSGGKPFKENPVEVFGMSGIILGAPAGAIVAALLPVGPPLYEAGPTITARSPERNLRH